MRHPDTPGAYLERSDANEHRIAALRTDVTGFVGIAERGPLDLPVAVETFRQFESVFGGFIGGGYLAYSVRAFFENGGARARIVRVASQAPVAGAIAASGDIPALGGGLGWTVSTTSPGSWGDTLSVALTAVSRGATVAIAGVDAVSARESTRVASVAGFAEFDLVRLRRPGAPPLFRVVAMVDPAERRIWWVHPDPDRRNARQTVLPALDPDQPLLLDTVGYDLVVRRYGRLASLVQDLSPVPEHPRFAPRILGAPDWSDATHPPPYVRVDAALLGAGAIPRPLDMIDGRILPLAGGQDGLAALTVADFIGDPFAVDAQSRGLASLESVREVALLAVPDILIRPIPPLATDPSPRVEDPCAVCPADPPHATPVPQPWPELPPVFSEAAIYQVQAAMIEQAERLRDRIALLDAPWDAARGDAVGLDPILAWRERFDSAFGAFYVPWLSAPDPLRRAPTRDLPPSGHVAGRIASMDLSRGVHRAPANETIAWVQDSTLGIDASTHGLLNTRGINVLRAAGGRTLRVLGARTVASDPDWRFLNVRRLVSMLRGALDLATQWAVFEPNDRATRDALTASVGGFLTILWQRGALAGATEDAAFRVRCDEINNPSSARARGELVLEIAIAPSIPFEFIVLRLGRSEDALEITERGMLRAGVG